MSERLHDWSALEASGLPEREALVWQTLAEHGPMNVSQLARLTRLHRPAMYELLPALIKKGLTKKTRPKGRVVYATTGPAVLKKWCTSKNRALLAYLNKQESKQRSFITGDEIQIFHGKELAHIWEAIVRELPKKSVFYRYDGYAPGTDIASYIPKYYVRLMEQKKLDRFVITNYGLRRTAYRKRLECASRMLPASVDRFEQGVSQFIFHGHIALVDFTTETAFLIKNMALAAYQARVFKFLFDHLPE